MIYLLKKIHIKGGQLVINWGTDLEKRSFSFDNTNTG